MQCDMCGKDEQLFQTDIEGGTLNVCKKCSRYGKVISVVREKKADRHAEKGIPGVEARSLLKKELVLIIADDYAKKIKDARQKLGLKQEELARMLAEKESLIHKMENGQFEPSISMARKLEKYLRIKLVEQHEESHASQGRVKSGSLTIGDIIQIKQKK
jgi:putative transcription factor